MVCRNCGGQSPDEALYCMHCGSRIVPYSADEARAFAESLKKESKEQRPRMPKRDLGTLHTKIVGVTHDNDDGASRQDILAKCRAGEHLNLEHRPVKQDSNAVAVTRLNGEQVGWLTRELAEELSVYLDAGARLDVTITELTGAKDGKKNLGCNIAVAQILS